MRTNRKTREIHIRLSDIEHQTISDKAVSAGMTISEFVRRAATGRRITSKIEAHAINELRRLGGLLKKVHTESGGSYSRATAAAIDEIRKVVRALAADDR